MSETKAEPTPTPPPAKVRSKLHRRTMRGLKIFGVVLVLWLMAAYLVLPWLWRHHEHNPLMASAPTTTLTSQNIPGDPLNIGLVGTEEVVVRSMLAAGWSPADPITLRTSLRIAESVVFKRPDPDAPVSSLFLFGRKQDLAFEKPVGGDARRRHHVRYWKSDDLGKEGVPLYIGSTTFDVSVGLSHDTGQITHHIAPDVDAQRDELMGDLVKAGRIAKIYQVTGVGATLWGHNGEGDRYFTDGELSVGVLETGATKQESPERLANPALVRMKGQLWTAIRPFLSGPGQ
jgi:LssY C-terminus